MCTWAEHEYPISYEVETLDADNGKLKRCGCVVPTFLHYTIICYQKSGQLY